MFSIHSIMSTHLLPPNLTLYVYFAKVGSEVDNLKVGDRVCMEPGVPDPNSLETRSGMYNVCRKLRFWATPPYAPTLLASAWKSKKGGVGGWVEGEG